MQSDGKSSFIEALVGFQFNIVDSSILFIYSFIYLCMYVLLSCFGIIIDVNNNI